MDDEIESLLVGVRADTGGFARDVEVMRAMIEGPLAKGGDRAGRAIESALLKAVRSGSFGFEDLRKVALSVLDEIAAAAVHSGIDALFGGGSTAVLGGGGGGSSSGGDCGCGDDSGGMFAVLSGSFSGSPGRATGGPVSPTRPYWVGERGPELFVPTTSGSVIAAGSGAARDVRVSITVAGGADSARTLAASSRQVARAVRAALLE